MLGAVLRPCDRLLTLLHTWGLHAAVLAGLVMMPVVVAAGFVTDRLDAPPSPFPSVSDLRGSLDPLQDGSVPSHPLTRPKPDRSPQR